MPLAQRLIEDLRRAKIIIPGLAVIERLCAEVITLAKRRLNRQLTALLSNDQREKLDGVRTRNGNLSTLRAEISYGIRL
jgi:hypothetical protein